jgi:hypothetical protein
LGESHEDYQIRLEVATLESVNKNTNKTKGEIIIISVYFPPPDIANIILMNSVTKNKRFKE